MLRKITTLALAAIAASSLGQLIVGNDQSGVATIWKIDVNTGIATSLYAANNTNAKPWGMAADNVNSILYWNNGGNLYSATFASLLSGTPTINSVTMTYNGGSVNFVGLGFNPTTGMLIGTRNIATEAVYEINPLTGISTLLFTYPTAFDMGGVEYDAATSKLYCLSDAAPTGSVRGLYDVVDATTQNFIFGYPTGETDIDGLAVGGGRAYYVSDGPNTSQANFYVIDIATATQVGTIPSPFTGSGTFSAATWAPGLFGTTINGTVTLGDYEPDEAGRAVVFEFYQGGVVMDTQNVMLGAGGSYAVTTALSGVYDVAVKASHWLKAAELNVNIQPGLNINYTLTNGDVDGDNEVNLVDVSLVSAAFGSVAGDSNWNPEADLDGDGEVSLVDYGIGSAYFGQAGY